MTGESDLPPDLATRADDLLHSRPNADQLAGMTVEAFKASGLDHDTRVLVWLAALVALDAPTESYVMNLGAASQTAVSVERVHQVGGVFEERLGVGRACEPAGASRVVLPARLDRVVGQLHLLVVSSVRRARARAGRRAVAHRGH